MKPGTASIRSAAATTSGSIPDEAKSRSTTVPADVLAGGRQPHRRQASRDVLLDGGDDPPAARLEVADERLGVPIVGDEHGEIGVTRESGLGPRRHRQAADQREPTAELPEVGDDATEGGLGATQGRGGGQEIGAAPRVAVLGARARLEPGDQQGLDLLVRRVGVLAAKLRAAHRLAQLAEVEGRPQAYRDSVRSVVSHAVILWPFPAEEKGRLVVVTDRGLRVR